MTDASCPATTPPSVRPVVNLALQGGGSHGAFTWGVLDALLEDGRVDFEGISGTSAGAMNAVALAHGFAQAEGKPLLAAQESARQSLSDFWEGLIDMGALSNSLAGAHKMPLDLLFGGLSVLAGTASPSRMLSDTMSGYWAKSFSPYQSNPLDINPLRNLLERQMDFEQLAAYRGLKVFVVATKVSTGKAEIFSGPRLTADAVMASACLPTVFQAVEIEGEHYWDGGYSGNPAIHPLIYDCQSADVLLVQINPIRSNKLPTSAAGILDRLNEITFNSALMAEMRAIDFVNRLLAQGRLDAARYKNVLMHRIDGGGALEAYAASTKSETDAKLIHALRDLGRQCAQAWLGQHYPALGVECSVNIAADYLDDLRLNAV